MCKSMYLNPIFPSQGKQFRKEYACLGEIRAFLTSNANIMALTATATRGTRKEMCKSLGLIKPVMILQSPEKANIKYYVQPVTLKKCSLHLWRNCV